MVLVICDICEEELHEPGGILHGPPDDKYLVHEYQICITCYRDLIKLIVGQGF